MHLLDIVKNSVSAGAKNIVIKIEEHEENDCLTIVIKDDGCGMSSEFLKTVLDPFTTTRTTRKVGMGLPLFKMAAELTGGSLSIESELGKGTELTVIFHAAHIDAPPLGDIPSTIMVLIQGSPEIEYSFLHTKGDKSSSFNTADIREALDGVPLSEPDVLEWIRQSIQESEDEL